MKNLLTTIICSFVMSFAIGQSLVTTSYVEQTSVSPKAGISVGLKNRYGIEYGVFYQESRFIESKLLSEEQRSALPRFYEKVFFGGYFAYPLLVKKKGYLQLNIRTGVVNYSESFVITPSLLVAHKVANRIEIGGGVGVRAFRPTFRASISLSI